MDFFELAKQRYSVRKYLVKAVEDSKIERILEAGRVAPTACNRQPQHVLVLREPESIAKVQRGANTFGAPLVFLLCGDRNTVWVRSFDNKNTLDTDVAIVTTHMMLEATAQGLGSCWISYFDSSIIRQEFALPAHLEPINLLAVGYTHGEAQSPQRHTSARKPLVDTISYEML